MKKVTEELDYNLSDVVDSSTVDFESGVQVSCHAPIYPV
jgi:hypothetical protein